MTLVASYDRFFVGGSTAALCGNRGIRIGDSANGIPPPDQREIGRRSRRASLWCESDCWIVCMGNLMRMAVKAAHDSQRGLIVRITARRHLEMALLAGARQMTIGMHEYGLDMPNRNNTRVRNYGRRAPY